MEQTVYQQTDRQTDRQTGGRTDAQHSPRYARSWQFAFVKAQAQNTSVYFMF